VDEGSLGEELGLRFLSGGSLLVGRGCTLTRDIAVERRMQR